MDLLRDAGRRVIAVQRTHDAMQQLKRHAPEAFVIRGEVLVGGVAAFLAKVAAFPTRPRMILTLPDEDRQVEPPSHVDVCLYEPFSYGQLLTALGDAPAEAEVPAAIRTTVGRPEPELSPHSPAEDDSERILQCCRLLTEKERDREELLESGLKMLLDLCHADRGSIMLKDSRGENLIIAKKIGFPDNEGPFIPVPLGSSLSGQVALKRKPLLVEHVAKPSREGYRGRSFLILPLRDSRHFYGVVNITDRRDGKPFSEADLERAEWLTQQLAVNLANANLWEELQQLAMVDTLTGLFNRRYFDRQFSLELERARRYDRQVTLALLDVDNFKHVNDRNGYAAGDALIRAIAEVIRKCFREVDIVTRWGGDEFAVLLPDTGRTSSKNEGESSSMHFVERVRRAVEREDFARIVKGLGVRITISGGVATYPLDASDRQGLFLAANQALHRAKRGGNNRICMGRDQSTGEAASSK
jgi:diguanylate cyclase (GGDEF)-like protein